MTQESKLRSSAHHEGEHERQWASISLEGGLASCQVSFALTSGEATGDIHT